MLTPKGVGELKPSDEGSDPLLVPPAMLPRELLGDALPFMYALFCWAMCGPVLMFRPALLPCAESAREGAKEVAPKSSPNASTDDALTVTSTS
jgi:hypothetical protein